MPRPIHLTIQATLTTPPDHIADAILDPAQWTSFTGWGPLPGIRSAAIEHRTPDTVGTRIAVTNTDGSTHTETITRWDPPHELALRLDNFSKPLSRLATHFTEHWRFTPNEPNTPSTWQAERTFELHPANTLGTIALRLIRPMLAAAVRRHMKQINVARPN